MFLVACLAQCRWLLRDGISSYVVFGLVIGCCGLFALCLPETRSRALFDTTDEEEHREKPARNGVVDVLA